MFKRKKWIIITVLAAVVVVVVGVIGGAVYAQSNTPTATATATAPVDPQKVLADKVAEILGLPEADVEAAFTQAQKVIRAERQAEMLKTAKARIDQMAADGKITTDQADQYKAWLESKPDVQLPGFGPQGGFGPGCGPNGFAPRMRGGFGRGMMPFGGNRAPAPNPSDSSGAN